MARPYPQKYLTADNKGTYIYSNWLVNDATAAWTVWTTGNTTVNATQPWAYWTGNITAAANTIWLDWAEATGDRVIRTVGNQPAPVPRTPEQIQADEDRARVARAEREERMAKDRADHEQAVQRAETLLHAHLSVRQRRSLRARNAFRVRGQSGRWYEITRGHHNNTFGLDGKGKRVEQLCVYATGGVPEADCMLAQALHIEVNEEQLRRVAHITPFVVAV